jgi:queuine tRNA-ribosyltransferase
MFQLIKTSKTSEARKGKLTTLHGEIDSPFFMPIATKGALKGVTSDELLAVHAQIVLSNTYHLFLRPGSKQIKKASGLHRFMNWSKPILTDSGGYQVFSLARLRKIKEEGVEFRSHLDGKKYLLTPEKSIEIQQDLGSDIMMVLDECVSYPAKYDYVKESVDLTTRWAERCKKYFIKKISNFKFPISKQISNSKSQISKIRPLLFGIVQGGVYKDLRKKSAEDLIKLDFDGLALGGLAVGEPKEKMFKIVDYTTKFLPKNKPRYLMGVGMPEEILSAANYGIDMFDCVIPTRNARHGFLFSRLKLPNLKKLDYKIIRIANKKYKQDLTSLDPTCDCYACKNFSKAYLHHLFVSEDFLGQRLATIHNIRFYMKLMEVIRKNIR